MKTWLKPQERTRASVEGWDGDGEEGRRCGFVSAVVVGWVGMVVGLVRC